MAERTRPRTSSDTNRVSLITCETVAVDTPAISAISFIFGLEFSLPAISSTFYTSKFAAIPASGQPQTGPHDSEGANADALSYSRFPGSSSADLRKLTVFAVLFMNLRYFFRSAPIESAAKMIKPFTPYLYAAPSPISVIQLLISFVNSAPTAVPSTFMRLLRERITPR